MFVSVLFDLQVYQLNQSRHYRQCGMTERLMRVPHVREVESLKAAKSYTVLQTSHPST